MCFWYCEVQDDKEDALSKKKAGSLSQPNVPHLAALTKTQQKLVDEIKGFGRLPKCNMGASPDDQFEYNLYQRYLRHKDNLPEDLLQDKADALDVFKFQLLLDFVFLEFVDYYGRNAFSMWPNG